MSEVLRSEGLSRRFGAVAAVSDATLSIAAGEWVSLVGPSGCGKTTLLQMLGLLDRPTSGRIWLDGVEPWRSGATARAGLRCERIGFVFQGNNLVEHLTAVENVALPAWRRHGRRGEAFAQALALLEKLGLAGRAGSRAAALSTGEAQRVAIARALVNQPAVVLADEPTGSLDRALGEEVLASLETVCAAGAALLVVTHDATVAARGRRILTMSDGRIQGAAAR